METATATITRAVADGPLKNSVLMT